MSVGDKTVSASSPQVGGGWEGGTARTGCPQSSRPPRLPPSCLPPLGGGPKPWPWGGGVSSACASLLFPIMSNVIPALLQDSCWGFNSLPCRLSSQTERLVPLPLP